MGSVFKNFIFKHGLNEVKWVDLTWLIILPIINLNYIIAGSLAESGKNISLTLDKEIPFISMFIFPYIYWYIFILLGLVFILSKSRKRYLRALLAIYIGMCICYLFYYLYPVEISRPVVANTTISNKLVNIIYENDRPFNCFPSIHVLNTYIIMRFTKFKDNNKWFYYTSITGILIILSTLFIKQHFILDGVVAIILAEVVILVSKKIEDKYIESILKIPYKIFDRVRNNSDIPIN
ncbi:phosphatase PAP2 family protein [Clostridium nigeriense]|uniref:phosphatase PAP2 family protein n=1 Tax=Clostridium nigeriense TaxID=1805470 RepID=UPI00082E8465|nr:phosphatase PAP2 family protein [Clostridium nigeriense]